MTNPLNVLIVEDEPLLIGSLKSALEHLSDTNDDLSFKINSVKNCDTALIEIEKAVGVNPFDLVLLDICIPPSRDRKLLSGEDLGLKLKSLFPKVKIIVFTSYNDNYRLNNILKTLNPDGFLIKSDVGFEELLRSIKTVIFDPPYYSKVIVRLLRSHATNNLVLDKFDRLLLYELSRGTKTKDLPNFVPLSKASIESRKRKLKKAFEVESNDDSELLKLAKEKGFI